MKQLRVLLLPHGWDASPLQGYPWAVCHPYPDFLFTCMGGQKQGVVKFIVQGNNTMTGTGRWTTDLQIWSPTRQPLHHSTVSKADNCIENVRRQWHDRDQTESLNVTVDSCFAVIAARQHSVATSSSD